MDRLKALLHADRARVEYGLGHWWDIADIVAVVEAWLRELEDGSVLPVENELGEVTRIVRLRAETPAQVEADLRLRPETGSLRWREPLEGVGIEAEVPFYCPGPASPATAHREPSPDCPECRGER